MEGSDTREPSFDGLQKGNPNIAENLNTSLQDENRSLKIRIAGVDTLSSLLRSTKDELETVSNEKESLEIELARLKCRCSLLEKDMAAKDSTRNTTGPANKMFESLLKENKKLKEELRRSKKAVVTTESIFGPEALSELVSFKEDLEMEIRNLQKAMRNQEEDTSISQVSRMLGQVTKLEYQLKAKEEECLSLQTEINDLKNSKQSLEHSLSEVMSEESAQLVTIRKDFSSQFAGFVTDNSTQTETCVADENSLAPSKDVILQDYSHVQYRNQNSLRRKGSRRASGEWNLARKRHSDLFEDNWNVDRINGDEQHRITQELLVQANEVIGVLTEENDKLLQANAVLLQDATRSEDQHFSREEVLERLRFLFSESHFEANFDEIECIQDIVISHLQDGETVKEQKDSGCKEELIEAALPHPRKEDDLMNNNIPPTPDSSSQINRTETGAKELDTSVGKNNKDTEVDRKTQSKTNASNLEAGLRCVQTRDSGVDICVVDCERALPGHVIGEVDESLVPVEGEPRLQEWSDESQRLKEELDLKSRKLNEAEEKLLKLEADLKALEANTNMKTEGKQDESASTVAANKRLWKSIGHIPSLVRSTTHQRIVFESDV